MKVVVSVLLAMLLVLALLTSIVGAGGPPPEKSGTCKGQGCYVTPAATRSESGGEDKGEKEQVGPKKPPCATSTAQPKPTLTPIVPTPVPPTITPMPPTPTATIAVGTTVYRIFLPIVGRESRVRPIREGTWQMQ